MNITITMEVNDEFVDAVQQTGLTEEGHLLVVQSLSDVGHTITIDQTEPGGS